MVITGRSLCGGVEEGRGRSKDRGREGERETLLEEGPTVSLAAHYVLASHNLRDRKVII